MESCDIAKVAKRYPLGTDNKDLLGTSVPCAVSKNTAPQIPQENQVVTSLDNAERILAQATAPDSPLELSVVMPCLNEADTVASCVRKAIATLDSMGIASEVIVADNGSMDGSQALASAAGARVVNVDERGYGAALMGGIRQARGRFVLMGDADDSYDFAALPQFY